MGVEGVIRDAAGRPITGQVTVRWQIDGYVDYDVTGEAMEAQGTFKFEIMRGGFYHGPKTSTLQIIESESNPTPLSKPVTWQVLDCNDGPERWVNVTFRHR